MIAPRLAAHMHIGAIRRLCEREGGFATILAKGDETAGDIVIILRGRDQQLRLIRRAASWDGPPSWLNLDTQLIENEQELESATARMRAVDQDLWLIELDVPQAERFIALLGDLI